MYSSGLMSDFGLAQIAAPSAMRLGSAPGFSMRSIGTATAPECSRTMRSIFAGFGVVLGLGVRDAA